MGMTYVRVRVANPSRPRRTEEIELLVDAGAMLSVVPRPVLQSLGIRPLDKRRFRAFGGIVERETGSALVEYGGVRAGVGVIFGEPGDASVMGATTLETLGYQVDPVARELKPTEMLLL